MLSGNAVEETNSDDDDKMMALITLLPTLVKQREQKAYKASMSISLTVWGHFLHLYTNKKGLLLDSLATVVMFTVGSLSTTTLSKVNGQPNVIRNTRIVFNT